MLASTIPVWLHRLLVLPALSDGQLVARCRVGDQAAWASLVERYGRYVFAIATQGYRLGAADAEDVFQETFARTFQHLDRLHDDGAIRPWIAQTTRRLCVDRLRAGQRDQLVDELPEPAGVDATLERLADAMAVRDALGTLPDHCQEVVDRFFTRDESYETIGSALGIPPGTIASRISRCLGRLREALQGTFLPGALGSRP